MELPLSHRLHTLIADHQVPHLLLWDDGTLLAYQVRQDGRHGTWPRGGLAVTFDRIDQKRALICSRIRSSIRFAR